MKKWLTRILILVCILTLLPLTAHAGDIPESLLEEGAQIFFGEVLSYHPDKEMADIEVSPVAVVKGDVQAGTKQTYYRPNPMGFTPRVGKVYLFTYYDEVNPTDIFEVTTYNTRTLKLRHVQGDMWKRFERYLNRGEYGEAKVEGMLPYTVDMAMIGICAVIVLGAAAVYVAVKKKRSVEK